MTSDLHSIAAARPVRPHTSTGGSPFTPSTTWLNATDSNYSCGSCGSHGPSCAGTLSAITLACAVEARFPRVSAIGFHITAPTRRVAADSRPGCPHRTASSPQALGFTLPYSSTTPSDDALKAEECLRAGKALRRLVDHNVRPLDILTRAAFENAMTVCAALGGSTDVVLSLIAVARACGIRLHLSDFQRVSDRTPVLVGLQPFGRVSVADFHRAGGTPALMKLLFEAGRVRGEKETAARRSRPHSCGADRRAITPASRGAASLALPQRTPPDASPLLVVPRVAKTD